MKKRGQIADMFIAIPIVLAVVIGAVVGFYILNEFRDKTEDTWGAGSTSDNILGSAEGSSSIVDYTVLLLVAGVILLSVIAAFFARTYPILLPLFIFLGVLVVIFAGQYSNVYFNLTAQHGINATATSYFPVTNTVMDLLPILGLVCLAVFLIVFFGVGAGGFV